MMCDYLLETKIPTQGSTAVMVLVVLAALIMRAAGGPCPAQNMSAPVHFTTDLNTFDYAYIDQAKSLLCCAEGYDSIKWYRKYRQDWIRLPDDGRGTEAEIIRYNGQLITIPSIDLSDQTIWKCDLVKENSVKASHSVNVTVQACSPSTKGPISIAPFPQNATIQGYGGNVTFYCTGDFGCLTVIDIPQVTWWVDDKRIGTNMSRYYVFNHKNQLTSKMSSILTVTSVRAEDTQKIFTCVLSSIQSIDSSTKTSVQIFKQDIPKRQNFWITYGIPIGSSFGCLLLVVLIAFGIRQCYGPQIKRYCYVKFPCCRKCQRCGKLAENGENFRFNAFIYTADGDEAIADEIKERLTERELHVFLTTDVQGNEQRLPVYGERSKESAVVIFVNSENLRADVLAQTLFSSFQEDQKVIQVIHIDKAVDRHELWDGLPGYQWPSDTDSQRKVKNFWCRLELNILEYCPPKRPLNIERGERERKSTSSQKPLLESPVPSPQIVENAFQFQAGHNNAMPDIYVEQNEITPMVNEDRYVHNNHIPHEPNELTPMINEEDEEEERDELNNHIPYEVKNIRSNEPSFEQSKESLDDLTQALAQVQVHSSNGVSDQNFDFGNASEDNKHDDCYKTRNGFHGDETCVMEGLENQTKFNPLSNETDKVVNDVIVRPSYSQSISIERRKASLTKQDNHALDRPPLNRGDSAALNRPSLTKTGSSLSSGQYSCFSSVSSETSGGQDTNSETVFVSEQASPENGVMYEEQEVENYADNQQTDRSSKAVKVNIVPNKDKGERMTGSLESGYCTSSPLTAGADGPQHDKPFPLDNQPQASDLESIYQDGLTK